MHSVSADIFYASSVASIFAPSTTTASYVRNSIYVPLYNYNPISRTREPDAEDSELQADRRRKRAEAAAINVEDILSRIGSTQVYCFGLMHIGQDGDLTQAPDTKILRVVASIPDPAPHLMVVQRRQPSRKTRPPVRSSKLMHHPYVSGASSPLNTIKAKCLSIEAQSGEPENPPRKSRRQRRWKEALRAKGRPPPQYYRPDFRWEGKCRGYGYGYPSYWKYERDTLK